MPKKFAPGRNEDIKLLETIQAGLVSISTYLRDPTKVNHTLVRHEEPLACDQLNESDQEFEYLEKAHRVHKKSVTNNSISIW